MPAREKPTAPGEREFRQGPSSRSADSLDALVAGLADLDAGQLRLQWRNYLGGTPPAHLPRWLVAKVLAQRIQIATLGDLDRATRRIIRQSKGEGEDSDSRPFAPRNPATKEGVGLKAGALLVREWNGALQRVMVLEKGFAWNGKTYGSLSQIAKAMTGTSWNGHRFFGLRPASLGIRVESEGVSSVGRARGRPRASPDRAHRTDESDVTRVAAAARAEVANGLVAADETGASRGDIFKILSNPIYIGRLSHKGRVHEGLHSPIVDQATWDRVQGQLADHAQRRRTKLQSNSDALLAGKLFDDRGNRMSPSHAAKGGMRWRYYVSQALLQGRKPDAGSVARVSAAEIEQRVSEAISSDLATSGRSIADSNAITLDAKALGSPNGHGIRETFAAHTDRHDSAADIRHAIERVTIGRTMIVIHLTDAVAAEGQAQTLTIRWTPPSSTRRREVIQGIGDQETSLRPMRVKARAGLVDALRKAHCWLDELLDDPRKSVETIAARERKTERSVRMTLSLAFLAPDIVKAAIEGRLPRGFGVTRLVDLPMAWSDQWNALGLKAPAAG